MAKSHSTTNLRLIRKIGVSILACWSLCATLQSAEETVWEVRVDYRVPEKKVPQFFASANINSIHRLFRESGDSDETIKRLGIRFMRFQMGGGLDYKNITAWEDEYFETLNTAVDKALNDWGVENIKFGISGLKAPFTEDGRLIEEDIDLYAEACAELVRRFSPRGNMRVRAWEPFNEWDHGRLNKMRKQGQDFDVVAKLYRRCVEKMKAVNPDILIGGPAMTHANGSVLEIFLAEAGDVVDFISWHDYATGNPDSSDAQVLKTVTDSNRFVNGVKRLAKIRDDLGYENIPLMINEFQVNYRSWKPTDPRTVNHFAGVFVGTVFVSLADTPVYSLFIHDIFGRHYGLFSPLGYSNANTLPDGINSDGMHIRSAGWVYTWFNELVKGYWVKCETILPKEALESERGPLLQAVAWREKGERGIMLVNKDESPRHVVINLGEIVPTEGYDLPVTVRIVSENQVTEGKSTGTIAKKITQLLPPMSVCFITYELK